ncbi:hypothetical protein ASTA108788_05175 [Asticcacaulis taihuensis]
MRGMLVKAASTVNMKLRTCALMVLAGGALLSGCASKPHYDASGVVVEKPKHRPAEETQAVRSSTDDQSNSWGDAVMAPLEDLNLRRKDIPEILTQAVTKPYDLTGLDNCEAIASEVTKLDSLLGADFDEPPPPEDTKSLRERGGEAAGDVARGSVRNATRSIIPFRGLVRQMTGAQRHQKEMDTAIQAGKVRRAYLKGVGMNKNCAPPAAPSWFVPRVYTDTYAGGKTVPKPIPVPAKPKKRR